MPEKWYCPYCGREMLQYPTGEVVCLAGWGVRAEFSRHPTVKWGRGFLWYLSMGRPDIGGVSTAAARARRSPSPQPMLAPLR